MPDFRDCGLLDAVRRDGVAQRLDFLDYSPGRHTGSLLPVPQEALRIIKTMGRATGECAWASR